MSVGRRTVKTKSWYLKHMPRKRWQRVLLLTAIPVVAGIIAFQLAWPHDRGLLLARVGDQSLILANYEEMASVIVDEFDKSEVELKVGNDKSVKVVLKDTGAEPNTEKMIERLRGYPWWARLIPGSLLLQPAQIEYADIYYSFEKFQDFSEKTAKKLTFEAKNARLDIKDGQVVTTEAVASSKITSEEVQAILSSTRLVFGGLTVIDVPAQRQAAQRTSKDLAAVRDQAEAVLNHNVTVKAGGQVFTPDKKIIAGWVILATGENNTVTLAIDQEKIKQYLATINEKVGKPAGQTDITIVDGREVSRTTGEVGLAINSDDLAAQLADRLLKPEMSIELSAQFIEIQPGVIYNSRYSTSEEGLRAYVSDVAQSRNMRISIVQLDGERWTAAAREHESIPSGSTYKLYVALVLFDKINKGEIHWDDPMLGTTVAGCFERMTVASTNPCAESWLAQFNRQYVNDFIWARGFSAGTSFTTGGASHTTAADLTKYMIGLYSGTLVNGANRDRLWSSLGRHPYRDGIPAGSAGVVHDKVGFLWQYVHDSAVVEHPRGTYVMTILTESGTYWPMAVVTREVERIMYP